MEIEFVSHAGFIIEANNKRICVDPWIKGKTLHDNWALPASHVEVDFTSIDYLFITHEHPDHFNFPTLKSIDEADRKRIKILYQKHASTQLQTTFEKLGFAEVIELPVYKWVTIDGIRLYCGSAGTMDSFLAIHWDEQTVLNLNDCVLNAKQYQSIAHQLGKVDFLFTQFSIANWVGNEHDEMNAAQQKKDHILLHKLFFQPKYIIPFASFIYFCNKENERINSWTNTPRDMANMALPEVHFLYPHDKIDTHNASFNSEAAVEKYMRDFKKK
jgi:L-ascorbate metabolism protein UlaG (beta-lactamase superfamily)